MNKVAYKKRGKRSVGKTLFIYLGLAWPILHFTVFWFCMNIGMVYNSFFSENINGKLIFDGLEHYKDVFRYMFGIKKYGMMSSKSWLNTLTIMGLALFINLPLTLVFSYMIYKKIFLHQALRVGMYVPCVLSVVILCLFYKISVSGTQTYKSLLTVLEKLGYKNQSVIKNGALADSSTAWNTILIFSVWTGVNGNLVYFSSAMARLPQSVFESAEIDGATQLRQFGSICIPLIWPTITTLSVTLVAGVFGWMMPSLLLTDGTSERASTLGLLIAVSVKNDSKNTVINAIGVLVAVFGSAIILTFRYFMSKITEEVEY